MIPEDWESDPFFREIVAADDACDDNADDAALCRWVRAKQWSWEVERLQCWLDRPSPMVQ